MRTLEGCLLDTEPVRLRAIARFWDIELSAGRPQEVAAQLAQAMGSAAAVKRAWDGLPEDQRNALQALLAAGGQQPRRIFVRRWGEIRAMGAGRMEREEPWLAPVSPAEGLWYRGLIFSGFEQEPGGLLEVVFVPRELQQHLPPPPPPPHLGPPPQAPEPRVARMWGDTLLDDACTLLAYLQNEAVRPTSSGDWPSEHRARVKRQLHSPEAERLAFLEHLMERLSWLRVTDARHLRPDPDAVTSWLLASSGHQRLALASAWRQSPVWNDLAHVPSLQLEQTGAWRNDPLLARRTLLRHLAACTAGTWYHVAGLVAQIHEREPDFQRPSGDYDTWYIRERTTGRYLRGFEDWDAVEGALIRHLLEGPLAWLGLVDVGGNDAGPADAFRLTPDGAAFVGAAELPAAPQPGPVEIRPDFTLLVPATARYIRFQVARIADWVRSGDPFVYRLAPASLGRARRQGITIGRILEFLAQSTRAPVPRFVEAALTRWEARGGEARLEQCVLLRLASEELMTEVSTSPFVRGLLGEQVGPAAVTVPRRNWSALIAALGRLGLLPDVIGLDPESWGAPPAEAE